MDLSIIASHLKFCVTMNSKFEFATVEAKDLEVKMLLEAKDWDLEEMKKRLKDQEKEKQSQLLKIQMEVRRVHIYDILIL